MARPYRPGKPNAYPRDPRHGRPKVYRIEDVLVDATCSGGWSARTARGAREYRPTNRLKPRRRPTMTNSAPAATHGWATPRSTRIHRDDHRRRHLVAPTTCNTTTQCRSAAADVALLAGAADDTPCSTCRALPSPGDHAGSQHPRPRILANNDAAARKTYRRAPTDPLRLARSPDDQTSPSEHSPLAALAISPLLASWTHRICAPTFTRWWRPALCQRQLVLLIACRRRPWPSRQRADSSLRGGYSPPGGAVLPSSTCVRLLPSRLVYPLAAVELLTLISCAL